MKVLLQRVSRAAVRVDGETVASIDGGLLVLLGVERDDTPEDADELAEGREKGVDAEGQTGPALLRQRVAVHDGGRIRPGAGNAEKDRGDGTTGVDDGVHR